MSENQKRVYVSEDTLTRLKVMKATEKHKTIEESIIWLLDVYDIASSSGPEEA